MVVMFLFFLFLFFRVVVAAESVVSGRRYYEFGLVDLSVGRSEHFVQAVSARVDLKRIGEEDEHNNCELAKSNEKGCRWVHSNDVWPDLERSDEMYEVDTGGLNL